MPGRVVDLFAGGGGASLGWHRAGWDVRGVEWWDVAARAHDATGIPCVCADVRDHAAWLHLVEPVTAIIASPPCQDWSSAGSRRGADGDRNGWPWLLDAIDAVRATGARVPFVVAENVEGMTHHPERLHPDPARCPGCYLESVVREFGARWPHAGWWLLDAADYGVPQHRRRVFVWGAETRLTPPPRTHYPTGGMLRPWWVGAETVVSGASMRVYAAGLTGMGAPRDTGSPAPAVTGKGTAWLGPSPTVTATEGRGCATDARRASRAFGRRLTPEEAAGLQGWPDCPLSEVRTVADRYMVVGNAVPPPLAQAIAEAVALRLPRDVAPAP